MLINASHEEESRVAIAEDGYLHELDIESAHKTLTKSNIYRGRITKIEPSLQAAFVEYGAARQGFLSLSEIHPDYWKEGVDKSTNVRNVSIQDVLAPKQELLVQVVKEERGNKGAALTTQISLAGRYLVLSPNTTRGGISRKLSDDDRRSMKEILSQLEVPENMGLIIRTAGKDQTLEALQRDYQYLRRLWDEIRIKGETTPSPALIYLEGDLATRAIRDHFSDDVEEIWVDNHEIYTHTKSFVHAVLPGKEKLVKFYRGKIPLFRKYGIESQCEEMHEREIRLPSGGSIVLDPTEALTAIDVNSARATKGKHIDDTALAINLEAAEEIARQLRIRDIGGLIVIDFIDMASRKHGQLVEETLRAACKGDKARIQFARISRFGLLEMSRQRLHPSVRESTTESCPRCQGRGFIRTVDSMALQMLTRMEDWAEAGKTPTLVVQVPSDTGEYLMNNKRDSIARIEETYGLQITLQIRPDLDIPHYRIERQWVENNQQRVEVLEDTSKRVKPPRPGRKLKPVKPVVGIPTPPPEPEKKEKKKGALSVLIDLLTGQSRREKQQKEAEERAAAEAEQQRRDEQREQRKRSSGNKSRNRNSTDSEQGKQPDANAAPENAPEGKKERRQRPPRKPRPKPAPAQATDEAAQPVAAELPAEQTADGEAPKSRRRRRRRRPSGNRGEGAANTEAQTSDNSHENSTPASEPQAPRQPAALPAPVTPTEGA
ncbi:Rne/Rng family ribonuclease [Mariprofundus erugo]|uniref:Ribonuclease G n=2 Tax=Mariprofundus erugo TaxID=2528639 RepID=A0A5R9GPV7_9PROT|nr:Rne/Rng family ribonuclease [Mariprofundus erugo]TLS76424.1 Rne/Rng family ribonuclease [Mariprofundus erugo]